MSYPNANSNPTEIAFVDPFVGEAIAQCTNYSQFYLVDINNYIYRMAILPWTILIIEGESFLGRL